MQRGRLFIILISLCSKITKKEFYKYFLLGGEIAFLKFSTPIVLLRLIIPSKTKSLLKTNMFLNTISQMGGGT